MLLGIVRLASCTSCPTIDEISIPENAKHNDDHRLSVVQASSRGTISEGANDVALPTVARLTAPPAIKRIAGIHVAMLPRCCTSLPAAQPTMLSSVQIQRQPRTNATE